MCMVDRKKLATRRIAWLKRRISKKCISKFATHRIAFRTASRRIFITFSSQNDRAFFAMNRDFQIVASHLHLKKISKTSQNHHKKIAKKSPKSRIIIIIMFHIASRLRNVAH